MRRLRAQDSTKTQPFQRFRAIISGMKYLGIDYGTKRIGLALSDEERSFAFPLNIISPKEALGEIQNIIEKEGVIGIVIGRSVASNGLPNELSEDIENFAKKLEKLAPVFFQREGFSSVEAHRYQTKKGNRDDSAAAIILQRFLDTQSMTQ